MDEDVTCEYSESFDSLMSGSSKNVKSLTTELERHDAVDTDFQSPPSTEHSGRWTAFSEERTQSSFSASHSKLRFSRYFSESENCTADLNPSYSSFESSLTGSSEDELDKDEEEVSTIFSASSNTDTRTCSSVSQEPSSVRWKDEDELDKLSSDSQHMMSKHFCDVFERN